MDNLTPFIIMTIVITILAVFGSLLLSAYMSTLNFTEGILLLYAEFHFQTHRKLKLEAYKNVHNQKIKRILHQIKSTSDKDLVRVNSQITLQDAKKIKELANELLKDEKYLINDENAKKEIRELGLNSFIYSYQMRLAFASDPNNQYFYSKHKSKSKSVIKNKQQLKFMRTKALLGNRNVNSNLDEKLLGAMITFDSIIQKLFKNKDDYNYAIGT